jgi:hypothetical protein
VAQGREGMHDRADQDRDHHAGKGRRAMTGIRA